MLERNGWKETDFGTAQRICWNCGSGKFFMTAARDFCENCKIEFNYWTNQGNSEYVKAEAQRETEVSEYWNNYKIYDCEADCYYSVTEEDE